MGGSPYESLGMSSAATGQTPSAETYLNKPVTPQPNTIQPVTPTDTEDVNRQNLASPYPGAPIAPYPAQQERVDVVPGLPLATKKTTTGIEPPYGMTSEGIQKWYQESPEDVNKWLSNVTGISSEDSVTSDGIVSKPDSMPTDMWSSLKENVEGQVGSESWGYYALPKLKEWFPDIPEEDLPIGAIWTDEIPAIKERLDDEYKLNELLDNVSKLDSQGLTIEDDLQAYVRGRDQYIKDINKMIDNVNNVYTERDVSDPRIRTMLDKYRNYLYMSKGRQEVRYTDYVNRSITEHEARLERATDTYNSNLKQFNSALADEKDMTEERYDMYSSMLKDMYNSLDDREEEIKKISDNELAKLVSDLKNANDIKDLLAELSGEDTGLGFDLSAANKTKSLANYLAANPDNTVKYTAEWNALSDAEKVTWITGRDKGYSDMVRTIKNLQDHNYKRESIEKMIKYKNYKLSEFSDIMDGYEKKKFKSVDYLEDDDGNKIKF